MFLEERSGRFVSRVKDDAPKGSVMTLLLQTRREMRSRTTGKDSSICPACFHSSAFRMEE